MLWDRTLARVHKLFFRVIKLENEKRFLYNSRLVSLYPASCHFLLRTFQSVYQTRVLLFTKHACYCFASLLTFYCNAKLKEIQLVSMFNKFFLLFL